MGTSTASKRPRVVVACSWFLKYAAAQAVGLSRAGADVAVLCRDRAEEFGGSEQEHARTLAQLEADGIEVLVLQGRIPSASALPSLLRLRRRLRSWAPDVVHAHAHNDPRLLLLATPYPLAVTVHDPVAHPGSAPQGMTRDLIERRWRREADLLVVHGEKLRGLVSGAAAPVAVVPHGTESSAMPNPVPAKPNVLFFGRLEPYKGVDVLLAAMERVWQERPDVTLEVVGEGPEAARVVDHPAIRFREGYLPESEVDAMLARATLVVLPYRAGSQSGVGSLAVGRGIPTVVTDVGALPELVADRSFVVPPGDAVGLAASLLRHVEHGPELRRRVFEDARERLSWEAVGRRSLELYARFLPRDGSGGIAA